MSGFVHLHCHSVWSLRDGAINAEALPYIARELGYEAVALTDHDALTGAARFARACRDAGVKPIYGAELTVRSDRPAGPEVGVTSARKPSTSRGPEPRLPLDPVLDHVTVIARDRTGYANLCRLISDAHLSNERDHPATTFEKIAARAEGLFVLSGCARGEVARLAAAGAIPDAIEAAARWRDAIGDGYRIEVFDHRGYGHRALRDRLLRVAAETGIPAVATNDVHYVEPSDAGVHELLHAIRDIVPLSRTHVLRGTSEYYFKRVAQMRALFDDVPEAADETLAMAEACDFNLDLGTHHFPDLQIPAGYTPTGLLAQRCYEGAGRRYDRVTKEVEDRLQHELGLIFHMGFAAYFLLVADIVRHTKETLGIRCACRGSAAGSLVCYVLGISDVDPVRYDLLFERFMNSRREELPDIDVDVESHRREEVLQHILDTYGAEQTAMCCMVDTFRARMAIREVGKALGLPAEEIDLVAKAFPRVRAKDIPHAIERLPELAGTNLRAGQLEQLFELCIAIDGFPRHLALHPSGVILSSKDLADRVPMQESFGGFTMLQADKDDAEELGLAKLDVLGVRMLSAIAHARDEIGLVRGAKPDFDALPHDDEATFRLIRTSRTLGCFQIESPGQRELLARFQPVTFDDLFIDISLFRPGPVKSDMVSPYLDRRHGFEDVRYPHPRLQSILAETGGVVVYHEQVIRVIAAATGCSLDDADYVRRHLDAERPAAPDDPDSRPGRKGDEARPGRGNSHPGMGRGFRELPEEIAWVAEAVAGWGGRGGGDSPRTTERLGETWVKDQRVRFHGVHGQIEISAPGDDVSAWFISAAVRNGFTRPQAEALWTEVFAFASFGFCKSHAAAFALPTYISAWLKAHYPAEFLAGVLTHDPGMYPRRLIVADARHFGIAILPVDVNRSDAVYRVESVVDGEAGDGPPLREGRDGRRLNAGGLLDRRMSPMFPHSGATCASSPRSGRTDRPFLEGRRPRPGATYGIRLALSEVKGISEAEIHSLVAARDERPFTSLEDLWRRTEVSQPVLENLVHLGALDSLDRRSRRELLWRARELASRPKPVQGAQLSFHLDEPIAQELSELPPYTPVEETEAEIEVTGIDARRHVMDLYRPLLAEIGCVPASRLRTLRNDSTVWVAGVKVASQTPAIRSGQRIIFVTLDDPTGPVDVTVFERVQARCARTVFHSWLLLVKGVVRMRGGASNVYETDPHNVGLTIVVHEVFDLAEIARDRAAGHSLPAALGHQRRRQVVTGLEPDREPAGRLWHASGGSAGR